MNAGIECRMRRRLIRPIKCDNSINCDSFLRPDKTRHELNPKTWTVSVNRLFDTQSGILPG
ncbi:hypothetical protein A6592_10915 [Escherichia coli]|nr:hypothetical protein A6592_10915 [Escherichia coli]